MSELRSDCGRKPDSEADAASKARAQALALNINWNVLYYPGNTEIDDNHITSTDPIKDAQIPLNDLLSKLGKDDGTDAKAASGSKSEAEIENANKNVIVKI